MGLPLRAALESWSEQALTALHGDLDRLRRRLALGADVPGAIESLRESFESDTHALATIVSVASRVGGDAAEMVDDLARAIEARAAALEASRAAASGAKLSGRLVAALPLVFLPVAPLARAPLVDATGLLLIFLGGGLAIAGMAWMDRLMPKLPDGDDGAASFADLVAAVMRGGVDLTTALATTAEHFGSLDTELTRARRLVRLGASWSEALETSDGDGLRAIGAVLERSRSLGVPAGTALRAWASRRRIRLEREFESATRRAGVLMMIPLATCVLPSFLLLAVAPFLRGLASG